MSKSGGKVIGFEASGKLHDEDYQTVLIPELEKAINENEKIELLWKMENFSGWDLKAAWDDFRYGLKIDKHVDKCAMVGDKNWEKWMTQIMKPFAKAEIRYFETNQENEAWEWLKAA
ncbi:STAS/SEC14 domain-containing protein [Xanthovirga aplysinae]|uniref:STAS/SEC14 domain-containing protein n=1 Tax=Xanthovirga aplysinae TaxID=2529853 RepID=UPI001656C098|nr:STAS/SEC14 domain-containing protein [Xanthovirga aplysinae]